MIVEGQGIGLWTRVRLPPIPFFVVRGEPRMPYHKADAHGRSSYRMCLRHSFRSNKVKEKAFTLGVEAFLLSKNREIGFQNREQDVHTVSYDEKPGIQVIAATSPDLKPNKENGTVFVRTKMLYNIEHTVLS